MTSVGCGRNETAVDASPKVSAPPAPTASVEVEQSQALPKPTPPLDQEAVDARRLEIEAEVARLGPEHAWAGVYSAFGTDSGVRIAIAPDTGYALTSFGLSDESTYACGRVHFFDEKLLLEAEYPTSGGWSGTHELFPVRWGDQRYLFFKNELAKFCEDVKSDEAHADALALGWTRSPEAKTFGTPQLPEPFKTWFDTPLVAYVASKSDKQRFDSYGHLEPCVVLDVGRDREVYLGMRLYRVPADGWNLVVVTVDEKTCEARCPYVKYFDELPIGAEFTTRRPSK